MIYSAYLQCLCWYLRDQGSLLWQKEGETNTQTLQTSALLPNYHVDFANEISLSLSLWTVPSVESKTSSFLLSWYTETFTQTNTDTDEPFTSMTHSSSDTSQTCCKRAQAHENAQFLGVLPGGRV